MCPPAVQSCRYDTETLMTLLAARAHAPLPPRTHEGCALDAPPDIAIPSCFAIACSCWALIACLALPVELEHPTMAASARAELRAPATEIRMVNLRSKGLIVH